MIQALLISVVVKKYSDQPQSRPNAARLLLMYALQLAVGHLGEQEAERIVKTTLAETERSAA